MSKLGLKASASTHPKGSSAPFLVAPLGTQCISDTRDGNANLRTVYLGLKFNLAYVPCEDKKKQDFN